MDFTGFPFTTTPTCTKLITNNSQQSADDNRQVEYLSSALEQIQIATLHKQKKSIQKWIHLSIALYLFCFPMGLLGH